MDEGRSKVNASAVPELTRIKILSMGDAGTGKSCIIKRFCEGRFLDEYVSTIGIDFGVKSFATNLEDIKVNFWDVGGDPVYLEIRNEFYKDTHGAFMVFDVCDKTSFDNLSKWHKEFNEYSSGTIELIVIGNKVDKDGRVVSYDEGKQYATTLGARFEIALTTATLRHQPCLARTSKRCLHRFSMPPWQ